MKKEEIKKLVSIIELSLSGDVNDKVINQYWKKYDDEFVNDSLLGDAWNELTHYISDYDIRKNDKKYEQLMRNKLLNYVSLIKEKYY